MQTDFPIWRMSLEQFIHLHGDTADIHTAWRGHIRRAIDAGLPVPEKNREILKEFDLQRENKLYSVPIPRCVKKSKSTQWEMMAPDEKFITGQPVADGFYYHVTSKQRALKIMKEGLYPGKPQAMSGGRLAEKSRNRVFLSDRGGINFWAQRIEEHLTAQGCNANIYILRIPKDIAGQLSIDQEGTIDAGAKAFESCLAVGVPQKMINKTNKNKNKTITI
jgi:hypothetical protein